MISQGQIFVGTVTGTGAAINLELGFAPRYVRVLNQTLNVESEWFDDMPANSVLQRAAAGTLTLVATSTIAPFAGVAGVSARGITIGTNVAASGNVLRILAVGGDD